LRPQSSHRLREAARASTRLPPATCINRPDIDDGGVLDDDHAIVQVDCNTGVIRDDADAVANHELARVANGDRLFLTQRVVVAAAEQLVEDSAAATNATYSRGTVADDLDRVGAGDGSRLAEQVADMQAEVLDDELEPGEGDATVVVLQRGE
jgi:hypothetical protein